MKLRGKRPENIKKRLKMLIYGDAKVGKTSSAIQFPNSYIIDSEGGTDRYGTTINNNKSLVYNENNFDEVYNEIYTLHHTRHQFKTLIIDSMTSIYKQLQEHWIAIFEKHTPDHKKKNLELQDFGVRFWQKVNSNYSKIHRLLEVIDMNVILISQEKDKYIGQNIIGKTYDSAKSDRFLVDYIFRILKKDNIVTALKIGERGEILGNIFPNKFEWSYENFCSYYDKKILEKDNNPVVLATKEQLKEIKNLIDTCKIDIEKITLWFANENVNKFSEMFSSVIQKYIDLIKG